MSKVSVNLVSEDVASVLEQEMISVALLEPCLQWLLAISRKILNCDKTNEKPINVGDTSDRVCYSTVKSVKRETMMKILDGLDTVTSNKNNEEKILQFTKVLQSILRKRMT